MPTLEEITAELWAIIKASASDLFEKDEDLGALQLVVTKMAKQRWKVLTGSNEEKADAKANLETWENIVRLKVAQKALKVRKGAESVLAKILGLAGKLLGGALTTL